ncbi:kynureninase [Ekhidna sp.]|uniref:kynureninase n=1 Tax=Ekhidna sp. TaxID=2608089 RepID=UPI00329803EE
MKEEALSRANELDSSDSLSSFRSQFHFPQRNGKDCIYLCGNSLGLQPKNTSDFVNNELKNWQERGVEGHFTGDQPWVSYHQNSKSSLAKIVGAYEHEVVAMNNLTTNLHLAMASFYQPIGKRTKILIERGAFPSDFYAVYSRIQNSGFDPKGSLIELDPVDGSDYLSTEEIISKIEELGDELALVMFPGVQYYTGQFFDIKTITDVAHKVGANVGFDLAHAIGNVPLQLHQHNVDFAVWCTYKYLNSGPGGVGGLFIHERHGKNKELPRLSGWWGHNAEGRFKMDNQVNPIPTVDGWQLSNVNILSHASHLASLRIFDEAGIENLRNKSLKLTDFMEELILNSEVLNDQIKIITPSNHEERGAQLSIYLVNHGKSVFEFLIDHGVILDWREPNVIRVAPVPLYNSFTDAVNFVTILEKAIRNEG